MAVGYWVCIVLWPQNGPSLSVVLCKLSIANLFSLLGLPLNHLPLDCLVLIAFWWPHNGLHSLSAGLCTLGVHNLICRLLGYHQDTSQCGKWQVTSRGIPLPTQGHRKQCSWWGYGLTTFPPLSHSCYSMLLQWKSSVSWLAVVYMYDSWAPMRCTDSLFAVQCNNHELKPRPPHAIWPHPLAWPVYLQSCTYLPT